MRFLSYRSLEKSAEIVLWIVVALAIAPTSARGQPAPAPAPPRLEIWGGVSGISSGEFGMLVSSYSPPLLLDGDFISHGSQRLVLDSTWHAGIAAGMNVFFAPAAGLQFTFDRDSAALSGVNGPYDVTLQYTSRPPPTNAPVPVSIHQSTPWPDTEGTITRTAVNANAVVRFGRPDRVSLTFSGGLTMQRFSGSVEPVAYTTFQLGGHSVLFQDDYRLAVALEPTMAFGFNLGSDVSAGIGHGLAVIAGYRYLGGPAIDVPLRDVTILNPDQILFSQTAEDIRTRLALAPVHLSVASSRVFVGLKVFF